MLEEVRASRQEYNYENGELEFHQLTDLRSISHAWSLSSSSLSTVPYLKTQTVGKLLNIPSRAALHEFN